MGDEVPHEAAAFCLNRYKILTVHGRKFNELDFMHSNSISLCQTINKANIQLFAVIPLNAFRVKGVIPAP